MPKTTLYVVIPFIRNGFEELWGEEPIAKTSKAEALALGLQLSQEKVGVIVFSRAGDVATGEYDDGVILQRWGETPEELF